MSRLTPCASEKLDIYSEQPAIFEMGFDLNLVARALQQFGGNSQQALEALLSRPISAAVAATVRCHVSITAALIHVANDVIISSINEWR